MPFDVLVLDGRAWHKMEVRNDFQWDPDRYPDPAGFVANCAQWASGSICGSIPISPPATHLFNELAEKGYLLKKPSGRTVYSPLVPLAF